MPVDRSRTPDVATLVGLARAALQTATSDHLTREMATVNATRRFDSRAWVEALNGWIAAQRADWGARGDAEFPAIDVLAALAAAQPRETAARVVLAEEHRRVGDRRAATETISSALLVNRFDLYASEVARNIFSWAQDLPADDVDSWLQTRTCPNPFSNLDVMPDGNAFVCCGDWLPVPIGNINTQSAAEIWHSPVADTLRASIVDGSFRYCNRTTCTYIANRTLPELSDAPVPLRVAEGPSRLVLSHDNSCNLSCPSCRTRVIQARKNEQDRLDELLESVFVPLLRSATAVRISGSGDPFASQHYRRLLTRLNRDEFPELWIDLHTNAQLFDERAWTTLELSGMVAHVEISIDAATADTYRVVRRGGSYDRLLQNLSYIRDLRSSWAFGHLTFSFVVQQLNYREMPAFVRLADEFGADHVDFRMILNWGTRTPNDFRQVCVGDPSHPEHQAYLHILDDPILHQPHVRLPET